MKLINLCEYTLNQSMYDEGIYGDRTAGDAQNIIDGLNLAEMKE